MKKQHAEYAPTEAHLSNYVVGFISSIFLTIVAYLLVTNHKLHSWSLVVLLCGLAFLQAMVQLFCFLHLGHETKPRWKLGIFGFMLLTIIILVVGSLWIMSNLNYRMMPAQNDVNHYLHEQDGI